jgi:hypothetical protein
MNVKRNNTNRIFVNQYNDAVKGTYKYWREMLEWDVYKEGHSYEYVTQKFSYGKYKPYWLSTNYWKKRFDASYLYWEEKRIADKNAGTYTGNYTEAETDEQKKSNITDYMIYGCIAIVVLLAIWMIAKKIRKK